MWTFEMACEMPLATQRLFMSSYNITDARAATTECSLMSTNKHHIHRFRTTLKIKYVNSKICQQLEDELQCPSVACLGGSVG